LLALCLAAKSLDTASTLRAVFDRAKDLQSPHLVQLLGCSSASASSFTVLFDRPALGTLATAVLSRTAPQAATAPATLKKISLHMALGLEYLHGVGCVHGALSPHTVYVDDGYNAKVFALTMGMLLGEPMDVGPSGPADVLLQRPVERGSGATDQPLDGLPPTVWWQAPEVVRGSQPTSASDGYSFAMVLWSLLDTSKSGPPHSAAFPSEHLLVAAVVASRDFPQTTALTLPFSPPADEHQQTLVDIYQARSQPLPRDRSSMTGAAVLLLDVVHGRERWEVDRSSIQVVEKLGSGQFGDVHKAATAAFAEGGSLEFVAVKSLIVGGVTPTADPVPGGGGSAAHQDLDDGSGIDRAKRFEAEQEFLAEIELMKRLRHPNLVSLLGVCTKQPPYLMVLEFLAGGSLDVWLPENGPKLSVPRLLHILHQVALGLASLGDVGVIHRDLAARNVLIDDRFVAKVADYGLSRSVEDDRNYYRLTTARALPLRWTAPEVLTSLQYTAASDVFSYGVLIYEVFSHGKFPFDPVVDDADLIQLFTDSAPSAAPLETHLPFAARRGGDDLAAAATRAMMGRCLARNPALRPSFAQVARWARRASGGGDSSGRGVDGQFGKMPDIGADGDIAIESETRRLTLRIDPAGEVGAALPLAAVGAIPSAGLLVDPKAVAVHGAKPRSTIAPRSDAMAPRSDAMAPRSDTMAPRSDTMAPRSDREASGYVGFGNGDGRTNVSQKASPLPPTQAAVATAFQPPATRGPSEITSRAEVKPSLNLGFDQSVALVPLPDETRL
jgi:serine/threonine protein kinase